MTRNQLHGKKFEDFIKACGLFPGASDSARSVNAGFDIEARFDRLLGLPTSIKASGNDSAALSDARRFFALDEPFRMIVGRYDQVERQKVFARVYEFILTPDALSALRGALTLHDVTEFHHGLLIDRFPHGHHQEARGWAKARKAELAHLPTRIVMNPKIDSKAQRRLQCSVPIAALIEICDKAGNYRLHEDSIGDFALPVVQNSARREFRSVQGQIVSLTSSPP